jgi:hypothetical protein
VVGRPAYPLALVSQTHEGWTARYADDPPQAQQLAELQDG